MFASLLGLLQQWLPTTTNPGIIKPNTFFGGKPHSTTSVTQILNQFCSSCLKCLPLFNGSTATSSCDKFGYHMCLVSQRSFPTSLEIKSNLFRHSTLRILPRISTRWPGPKEITIDETDVTALANAVAEGVLDLDTTEESHWLWIFFHKTIPTSPSQELCMTYWNPFYCFCHAPIAHAPASGPNNACTGHTPEQG